MGPGSCSCGRCRFRFPLSKVGVGPRHAWRLVDKRVRWRGRNKRKKLLKRFERPWSLELPNTWPFYLLQVEPHGGSGKLDMSNCHCAWCRRAHSVPWWKIWSWWWRSLSTSTQWLFLNLATDWKSCFGAATQVLNHILASILIFTQLLHVFSLQNGECSWIVGRIINVWQVWCRYTFSSWFFLTMGMSTCTVPRQLLPPMSRLEAKMFSRKCAWMMPECLAWNLKCESPSGVDLICRASERCGNGGRKNRPMWSFRQGCDEECEHVFFPTKVYIWAQKRTKRSMNEQ